MEYTALRVVAGLLGMAGTLCWIYTRQRRKKLRWEERIALGVASYRDAWSWAWMWSFGELLVFFGSSSLLLPLRDGLPWVIFNYTFSLPFVVIALMLERRHLR